MTVWNSKIAYYVRLRNILPYNKIWINLFIIEKLIWHILMQTACFYLQKWQSYTLPKFELWRPIVTLTFDLWPKYFFRTCYTNNTNYLPKTRLPPTLTLEIPWTENRATDRHTHRQTDRHTNRLTYMEILKKFPCNKPTNIHGNFKKISM